MKRYASVTEETTVLLHTGRGGQLPAGRYEVADLDATAHLTETLGAAHVRLTSNGFHVATYHLTKDDGPGPIPAADTVLTANGWRLTDSWEQVSGGVTGAEWIAHAKQAEVPAVADDKES